MAQLSSADAAHLLRRTGFGGSTAEVAALTGRDRATAVDAILTLSGAPAVVAPPELTTSDSHWDQLVAIWHWWFERMRTTPAPLQERMVLFWHNHFATGNDKLDDPLIMFEQNQIFRSQGFGSFRTLTHSVVEHAAMILYLDNDPNEKRSPNENLARELMELFVLGVDQLYTQADVADSARAWTGHGVVRWDDHRYQFHPDKHDTGSKTIFGVTRNWDGPELIDHMLADDAVRKRRAARFISSKLWSWFAYPNPEAAVAQALENAFFDSDLDITALLRTMLNRDEFYSARATQGLVFTPVEYLVASLRRTGLSVGQGPGQVRPDWYMGDMGQQLLYPPNVSGWRQNNYWISSAAFWAKADWAQHLGWTLTHETAGVDDFTFLAAVDDDVPVASRPSPAATASLVFDAFGIDRPSAGTRASLEAFVTQIRRNGPPWDSWSERVGLIVLALLSPEFQLA